MNRLRYACIMIGGFLGPFAGQSLAVVLPEFAADFGISLGQASLTMTAYMLPFAVMMLFSGHIVRNVSPTPVVRTAYAVIAAMTAVLVFTPWWWLFVAAFIIAGICNAFTAPLLQLILRHITPEEKLGQALGTYQAMQSFGLFSAPLVAGLTSLASWRWMYVFLGVFALAIVAIRVPYAPPKPPAKAGRARLLNGSHLRAMVTLLAVGTSVIGLSFIVALYVGERFDADPVTRGLIVMVGGLTGFLFARFVGGLADNFGVRPVMVGGLLVAALAVMGVVASPSITLVAALWGVAVLAVQGTQVAVNMMVLRSPSGNQMLSTVQAFRFFGNSFTPLAILPLYHLHAWWGFGAAAIFLLAAAAMNAVRRA